MMSQMPLSDDVERKSVEATDSRASDDVDFAPILPDDHTTQEDKASANETLTDVSGVEVISTDQSIPREFTFFQKKKRADRGVLVPSMAYVSFAQLTAFSAQLDSARAANDKTKRHIAELMILMSDVARTVTLDEEKPRRKRLRLSKWLFYTCLVVFGVGWFLLSPFGHNVIRQMANFW